MLRRFRFVLLPVLAVAAIVVAGCGSSNSPSASAGGSTGGGTGTVGHAGLGPSSSVSSPAAVKFLVAEGERGGLTPSQSRAYISCFEKVLAAKGITTFEQFHSELANLVAARNSCIAQAKKA